MTITKSQRSILLHLNRLGSQQVKKLQADGALPERWAGLVTAWLKSYPPVLPKAPSRLAELRARKTR